MMEDEHDDRYENLLKVLLEAKRQNWKPSKVYGTDRYTGLTVKIRTKHGATHMYIINFWLPSS